MASNPRIDDLRKRLEKDPGSRLFAQLAEELRKDGELEEAIRVCREGLQKHPAYPSARMTLGRALMDTGDMGAAKPEFEAVLKGAPDNILASRYLGECLEQLGDVAGAIARYRITLSLAPGDKQVQARLQALEARPAVGGAMPVPVEAATAGGVTPEPPLTPIRLAEVEAQAFELERPYELPATGASAGVSRAAAVAEPGMVAEPEATGRTQAEPAPIPLAEVGDQAFELERPWESPTVRGEGERAPLPAPSPPAPGTPGVEPAEFEFEAPVEQTVPFQPRPLLEISGASAPAPASPASVPASATIAGPPEIASPTLAELYFNQGFTEKAIEVYQQLVQREPGNDRARARLKELEALQRHLGGVAGSARVVAPPDKNTARRQAIERTIARLEGLRVALRRE